MASRRCRLSSRVWVSETNMMRFFNSWLTTSGACGEFASPNACIRGIQIFVCKGLDDGPQASEVSWRFAMNEQFESIWDAIEDSPAEAQNMKIRSAMMTALCDYIKAEGLTQKQAAKKLGVTQPRISDLVRGRIDLFAIDGLVNMLALAGLRIEMHIGKAA